MKEKEQMDKQKYNRKRRKIYRILLISNYFVLFTYFIFLVVVSILYGNEKELLITIVGILTLTYVALTIEASFIISTYNHPKYGKFVYSDEFKSAKKYKYKNIDIIDFLKKELTDNSFVEYESEVDFIKGTYYYKQKKESIILSYLLNNK